MQPNQLERIVNNRRRTIRRLSLVIIPMVMLMITGCDEITDAITQQQSRFVAQPSENTVTLSKEDVNLLNTNYRLFKNEFALCFMPAIRDGVAYYRAVKTSNHEFTGGHVEVICPSTAEMIIHSHPDGVCEFSDDDIKGFKDDDYKYEGIICGIDGFVIIDRNLVKQSIVVV